MLEQYLLDYHSPDLINILEAEDVTQHYSIEINFVSLFEANGKLAKKIVKNPRKYITNCDESIISAQKKLFETKFTVKNKVHTRITAVPIQLKDGRIGELTSTSGIMIQMSQPSVFKVLQRYSCNKCNHVTIVKLEWERRIFEDTKECEACHSRSISANPVSQQDDCSDYQSVKIEEKFQIDSSFSYNKRIPIVFLDDLVDKCRPGDRIDICGWVIRQWDSLVPNKRPEATTFLMANSISVRSKMYEAQFSTKETKELYSNFWESHKLQPLVGRDIILNSLCPQIYGMYTVKLAIGIVLAGGIPKTQDSGSRVRGEPHLLLIGDPGTAKSQFLRTASRLALRSVLTTGIGSTAAGLTAAAIMEEGGSWQLEGGALVLADGGVCCIDEFSSMRAHDRGAIHEAMEQQTVSVAKAGLVSTLNSRCSVIAATNPSGGHCLDGVEVKTKLGDPLLSRFDLILVLRDNRNPEWDRMISSHVLKAAQEDPENTTITSPQKPQDITKDSEVIWSEETLRDYFAHVHSLRPVLSPEATEVLKATFCYHRSNPDRQAERTTVRLLDSLIRLAEGHARLMYRDRVELMDALVAAQLVGNESFKDTHSSSTGCPFPKDPMEIYRKEGKEILNKLKLGNLIGLLYKITNIQNIRSEDKKKKD